MEAIDKNYKKILFLMGGIIAISVIVILTFTLIPIIKANKKSTILNISIAPSSAKIEINGAEYRTGSYDSFKPGSYTATISEDGFTTKTLDFELKKGETTTVRDYILNISEGFSYFERSKTDINTLREIDDTDVNKFLRQYDDKLEIKNHFPILLNYYDAENARLVTGQIYDGSNNPKCTYAFCLLVNTDKSLEWRAKEVVELAGYKYDDYEVVYEKNN